MSRAAPFAVVGLLGATAASAEMAGTEVRSPDSRIAFALEIDTGGTPVYSVRYRGETVVGESRLGLRFAGQHALDSGLSIAGVEHIARDSTWEQPWGERRHIRECYNELFVTLEAQAPARTVGLRVRVFDDGLGFRYELPDQAGYGQVEIVDELTEFRLPVEATAWWIPGRSANRYEYLFRKTPVADVPMANTPMTIRLDSGVHLSLHEAALIDYAGYVLDQRRPGVFQTWLTPWSDGIRVRAETPLTTPWRSIQIAPNAAALLNSTLILNLNEPNALGDVPWVEPGKYIGIWWAMHLDKKTWGSGERHGATTDAAKRYIDFAAEHGFDGVLVEGWNTGWDGDWSANGALFSFTEPYPDFDLEAVARYARDRGLRLIGHHETAGHVSNYERQMEDAFELYASLGVRQVKTGYVADAGGLVRLDDGIEKREWHEGQFAVNHFQRVVEAAAEHNISINTHEPVKDTGLRRTYPNWISREGARGQEYNAAWAPPNPPAHNVTLPFTRMLGGPMDFTPGIFELLHQGSDSELRVQSTLAHQLALYVVLYSPIQMAADLPDNYARRPDAFQFIKDVPTDWEQSIALDGEVGDFIVFARRERGADDWYVGAIAGDTARQTSIPLGFLDADRDYRASIYRDGDEADWQSNPFDYVVEERTLAAGDTLALRLAAGGGAAVRLSPVQREQ